MVRKEEMLRPLNLEVKVPTFFRCPISLDVMQSPVSLCTGVTYDRPSIQRWLDSGNNTCPATMQPLPSTDLIPNLTLRRLIHLWSVSPTAHRHPAANLLRDLHSSSDPSLILHRLSDFFLDPDTDDFEKNGLVGAAAGAAVSSVFIQNAARIEILEPAARVIALILAADCIEEKNKQIVTSSLISDLNPSVSGLIFLLKEGKTLESRSHAARILREILLSSNSDLTKASIVENPDLIPELIRLISEENRDRSTIDGGIECLVAICGVRRARLRMVKEGIVPAVVKVLIASTALAPASTADKALRLLAAASGIPEGRSAICEAAAECLEAVLQRMMKVGREGMEAAVMVLWSVCHRFRDRRAVEAVAAANGGMTKILLLMQSNCSPAVRQMSGDLLKICRVNTKSCLARYDTKTTHIMPF